MLPLKGVAIAKELGCKFAPTDVTSADDVGAALDAVESFGDGAINTVVNCAFFPPFSERKTKQFHMCFLNSYFALKISILFFPSFEPRSTL